MKIKSVEVVYTEDDKDYYVIGFIDDYSGDFNYSIHMENDKNIVTLDSDIIEQMIAPVRDLVGEGL